MTGQGDPAPDAPVPRAALAPGYTVSRIIRGNWQLARGHGPADASAAVDDLLADVDAGITTFDAADIYTGVESLLGAFVRRLRERDGSTARDRVQLHTKFVPDLSALPTLGRADVERVVHRSLRRLGVERVDLVQFHWWDLAVPRYVETALELARLRDAGLIREIGLTNFGAEPLREIADAGVPVVADQVQCSVLDRRAHEGARPSLAERCAERGAHLLAYGALAGGFLSERWLGAPEPAGALENRSLVKYRLVIEEMGGWATFQSLLAALARVARARGASIAQVAIAHALAAPRVAAVIVGAAGRRHLADTRDAARLALTGDDLAAIARALSPARGPLGDVYALERDRAGPHGRIMRYELQGDAAAE